MGSDSALDLDVQRGVGELLGATFSLFARHALLFLSVTLLVVASMVVLVDGVWGRVLSDGPDAAIPVGPLAAGGVLTIAVPVLVTALHAGIVWALASGGALTVREGLRVSVRRSPVAVVAAFLYTALTLVGFRLLIVPGIWVAVIGYFVAQAAVLERAGPIGAFKFSIALVSRRWWWTFGALVLGWLLFALTSGIARAALGGAVESGVLFTALFGTLLYFSLRARAEQAALLAA
jgi:hypothetical protein